MEIISGTTMEETTEIISGSTMEENTIIEDEISQLLKTLQKRQEDAYFFKESLELFIPPQVGRYFGDDQPEDATEIILKWLKDEHSHCLLLLGDSGAGKTLLGQWFRFAELKGHTDSVNSIAFHPQGHLLASGSSDYTIRLWDIEHQKSIAELKDHTDSVNSIAFHPQGHLLASGSLDSIIRLLDIQHQKSIAELKGHTSYLTSIAFHPQLHLLASGSDDNTIRLWDTHKKQCLFDLSFSNNVPHSLSFCQVEEKNWLCAAIGNEIYHFEVKILQSKTILSLIWSSGRFSDGLVIVWI